MRLCKQCANQQVLAAGQPESQLVLFVLATSTLLNRKGLTGTLGYLFPVHHHVYSEGWPRIQHASLFHQIVQASECFIDNCCCQSAMHNGWVTTNVLTKGYERRKLLLFGVEGTQHVLKQTDLQEGRELQRKRTESRYQFTDSSISVCQHEHTIWSGGSSALFDNIAPAVRTGSFAGSAR